MPAFTFSNLGMSSNYQRSSQAPTDVAFHKLGQSPSIPMTAEQVLINNFAGGYTLSKRPITLSLNGEQKQLDDNFMVVRDACQADPNDEPLEPCKGRFFVSQPMDFARKFDGMVGQPVETFAIIDNGARVFVSWKMPKLEVREGDVVEMFAVASVGFVPSIGKRLFTTIYRPKCKNTYAKAEGWANKNTDKTRNKGNVYSGKSVSADAMDEFGYWMEHLEKRAILEADQTGQFLRALAGYSMSCSNTFCTSAMTRGTAISSCRRCEIVHATVHVSHLIQLLRPRVYSGNRGPAIALQPPSRGAGAETGSPAHVER